MQFINRILRNKNSCRCVFFFIFICAFPSLAFAATVLKVGVSNNTPTLSFKAANDNRYKGFCVDLAQLLASCMDATAEIYPMEDSKLIPSLLNNDLDFVIGVMDNSYSATNMIKTSVQAERAIYINSRFLNSFQNNTLHEYSVAIEKGQQVSAFFPPDTDLNFIETKSEQEALSLVDSGAAQIYISKDSASTYYIINQMSLRNIKQVGMPIEIVPLVIAVHKNNPELLTSLSIAYGKILEDGRYHRIFYKWLGNNLRVIFGRFRTPIIGMSILIVLSILLFARRSSILKRKVTKISKDLQLSEQKYKDLIESSPDMIHLISAKGDIRLANIIALKRLKYDKKELAALKLQHLVPNNQTHDMTAFIEGVFQGICSKKEFTLLSKDAEKIQVEMVATVVRWYNSFDALACCFSRDLTERKHLEEELIRSDRLAIIGRMASGIAHEINNPLSIILSNVDDVLHYELDPQDSKKSLKSIERNALRAANIIQDLLAFTRPGPLRSASINLSHLIENTLFYLKQRLKQKEIRIEKRCPEDLSFYGNENLIQQLLINLILNSIQAIQGQGTITIRAQANEIGEEKKIAIEVEDNGIGIAEDDFEKIFDPFFTSRKEEGFGLGLFLSKIIVEKHSGFIATQSKAGKGTVMKVELPVDPESIGSVREKRKGSSVYG